MYHLINTYVFKLNKCMWLPSNAVSLLVANITGLIEYY